MFKIELLFKSCSVQKMNLNQERDSSGLLVFTLQGELKVHHVWWTRGFICPYFLLFLLLDFGETLLIFPCLCGCPDRFIVDRFLGCSILTLLEIVTKHSLQLHFTTFFYVSDYSTRLFLDTSLAPFHKSMRAMFYFVFYKTYLVIFQESVRLVLRNCPTDRPQTFQTFQT